jgi:DNA-binding response OmpR family regulator
MTNERKHILCIDDDRETAGLIGEELVERGFSVTLAHSGQAGLTAILRDKPDLVLSDVTMPGMSGFDVLEQLLAQGPGFRDMPFIFLTALTDRDNELRGRRLGADDYVTKPIDFDILCTIIEARLARVARDGVWAERVGLSKREAEVLGWAARGKTSAEIARITDITKRTVDFHIDSARIKLNAVTRLHAAVKAASAGLIEV